MIRPFKILTTVFVIVVILFMLGFRQYLDPVCIQYTFDSSSFKNIRGIRYRCGGAYEGVRPSISSDNKRIVFGCTFWGYGDICLINPDGSGLTRLTTSKEYEGYPSFSPNGDKIVFVSEKDKSPNIYIMDSDGSNQMPLTQSDLYKSSPTFSPDGKQIVYVGEVKSDCKQCNCNKLQIFIMNIDGTDNKIIKTEDISVGEPSFSPSGRKILYTAYYLDKSDKRREGLKLLDFDSLESKILFDKGNPNSANFSPDGSKIIFDADLSSEDKLLNLLYTMDLDSNDITKVFDYEGTSPSFYQNGDEVLFFQRKNRHGGDICSINTDGTEFKVITTTY